MLKLCWEVGLLSLDSLFCLFIFKHAYFYYKCITCSVHIAPFMIKYDDRYKSLVSITGNFLQASDFI